MTGIGGDPELLDQALTVEQTEDGLGVADVDCEQQGLGVWRGMGVLLGRACTKERGRLSRRQGWIALVAVEAAAIRRVQAPIQQCSHFTSGL